MLKKGDSIGLVACSNGRGRENAGDITRLEELLLNYFSIECVRASTIFKVENERMDRSASKRAEELMKLYQNPEIKAIFDISGGDVANEILPYLDFEIIRKANKPFVGYSDLTVVLNAVWANTGVEGYNYQILHLTGSESKFQLEQFKKVFLDGEKPVFPYEILRKATKMRGEVIGGNIRCLLKLAGTRYLPDPAGKTILLEAMSGNRNKIATYFAQLDQIGYLEHANGIILGTFSELEKSGRRQEVDEIAQMYMERYNKFLLKTTVVGHNDNAWPFPLGKILEF
ncbi:LD-carboxypeptidase [Listeria rocourtiae]|uniref:LD-carboxypeptidase n=1 Tax=Listeria rocourtiae TaxID=647910 RepID=UPI0016269974|nr:LD-carboxypeptidase [Listeria rocourtiae]MBC1435106.1 LD-carboxypeptidase [Listeria rocourtiae]MBC1604595.1 LD-carboxypeptidase [Listeria rocourtiae]